MSSSLESIADALARPLLPEHPFPTCITACNSAVVERIGTWAAAQRAKVEVDFARLRARDDAPEAWELSALAGAVREWRVFATFHRLHEEHGCPALLFRLATKTDLLTLCDSAADSSAAGFGDRQKQVLAKRGIADRFTWAAARKMVTAMGLIDGPVTNDDAEQTEAAEETLAVAVAGDGASEGREHEDTEPEDTEAAVVAVSSGPVGEAPVEETPVEPLPASEEGTSDETDPEEASGRKALPEQRADDALPPLRLNHVWSALPTYTKKKLEAVYERFGVGLWSQFGDRFYSSMRKAEMLTFVQRVVRHHACLDAAERLTDRQLDTLYDWMRFNLTEPYQRDADRSDPDLQIAARLFGDFQAAAALSRDGHGLSPEAWNQYRKADLRRIAAFCYHRFYEAKTFYEAETVTVRSGEAA